MRWGLVLYILMWMFAWPLALIYTIHHVLKFLSFASDLAKQKQDVIEANKMNY